MANRQLEEIHDEIVQRFSRHPAVSITPLEGDPPEKYQIRYLIKGLQKNDNDIEPLECEEHLVTIAIPFGFPHFPPSCIPDSPVFHPDFDPAAICIGEFWSPDKKLPDLIIHLGQLLCGEKYSTENAFNEDAAAWYLQHADDFPLTTFPVDAVVETGAGEIAIDDLEEVNDDLELDIIDDTDLTDDLSYLSLEDSDTEESLTEEPPIPESRPEQSPDHDLIGLLQKQKRYQALNQYLHNLPADVVFDTKNELLELTDDQLQKAQGLYREAESLEHEGQTLKSLKNYNAVLACVSDFPGIEADITRLEQAAELLGSFEEKPPEPPSEPESKKTTKSSTSKTKKKKVTLFEDKGAGKSKNYVPYAIGGILLICLCGVGFIYYTNTSRLTKAERTFNQCQTSLGNHDFGATDKLCSEALIEAQKIRFFKTGPRDTLISNIELTLSSEALKQGLAGNVKYKDRYISVNAFKSIESFNKLLADGEKAYTEEDWTNATDNLSKALEIASKNSDIDRELIPQIEKKLNIARFTAAYNNGVAFSQQNLWKEAIAELTTASTILPVLDKDTRQKYENEINQLLQKASYRSLAGQADELYNTGHWAEAVTAYKDINAQNTAYLTDHPEKMQELLEKIAKAELYSTIQAGKDAFGDSNWDLAVEKYDRAINLLNENRQSLNDVSSQENRRKLSLIKLQAAIIRDQQGAALDLKNKDYATALKKFQRILDTIEDSHFNADDEIRVIADDTRKSIESTRDDLLIRSKVEYLNKNYQTIFIDNFPAATQDSLKDPKIEYLKKVDNKLLFKMECLETGGGRPLRLVINYLFDPATEKWSFYTP